MKTLRITLVGLMMITLACLNVKAQTKGSGNVTTQERQVSAFDAIKIGCANLMISQGEQQSVKVETDDNLQDRIVTKVSNGTLELSCNDMKSPTKMNVYVTAVKLTKLEASGASKVKTETLLKSDVFSLYTSGAARTNLNLETGIFNSETSGAASDKVTLKAKTANTEVSGAGNLVLKGMATEHKTEVSGAGNLKALEFITDNTDAEVSGAGNARVMARKQLKADLSGAGTLTYFDKDNIKKISHQGEYQITLDGMDKIKSMKIEEEESDESHKATSKPFDVKINDTISVTLNDKQVVVITDDSVKVKLGQRDFVISDDGIKMSKHDKKPKFNGHWAGFEMGINGLLNNDMKIDYPAGYSFMDLNYSKSIGVNINFFEQNVNLWNQHLGLVTGMGFTWNNYRFADNALVTHNGQFDGYLDTDPAKNYEKSKLMVASLRVPLLLEFQTNSKMKSNSFHIAAGVIGDCRLWSHTKTICNGTKSKDKGDFYINPFRADATARIGWGVVNLYATYALTKMFREGKGPEVYPFEMGITLAGF